MALRHIFHREWSGDETRLAHALRTVSLFRDAPASDLVAIWRRLREATAPAGAVLCQRGEPGDCLFIVQSGTLEVRIGIGPAGLPVRIVGPGDFVGERALLTGEPRSADVVATDDSVLWVLGRADFDAVVSTSIPLLRAMNRALADRVELMTRLLEQSQAGMAESVSGLRFGPYRVVAQLGAGGMSVVYSAVHSDTETAAAVKVLPAAWGEAPEFRARLAREGDALQRIDHPNVVRVLGVGDVDARLGGGCYLAMEWLPNALDRVLRAQYPEPLSVATALRLVRGAAEGLEAVHAAGLVHRDVKPSNVLLRADGTPVLADFGLVALLAETGLGRRLTPTNVIVGTADYLSPEQVTGDVVDGRADIYSLGVVLYELLAGYVPFAGRAPLDALNAHVAERPPALPPDVPEPARAIVERALQKRREDRFPSAGVMAACLGRALGQVTI